jgi:hypothetical protein
MPTVSLGPGFVDVMELDRCYAIQGADILFTPTQSWGPDALSRDLRDISRTMDGLYYLAESTHPSTEAMHRSLVIDPAGAVIARSEYRKPSLVTAVIDLDAGRPLRYLRVYDPHKPEGYLPEYPPARMPRSADDLLPTILQARRPSLYRVLATLAADKERNRSGTGVPDLSARRRGAWHTLRSRLAIGRRKPSAIRRRASSSTPGWWKWSLRGSAC